KKLNIRSSPVELTSRESSDKIKAAKARLEQPWAEEKSRVDVLLASNMISVGVDIDRLGVMVVAGQPKTTSEYIQASSRVGRKAEWPGLVVTCFNMHKPRDRSHYERFAQYHASFYRFVEAQSLTPFAGPALDRGLAGTLLAMMRLGDAPLTPPSGAMELIAERTAANACVAAMAERAGSSSVQDRAESTELKRAFRFSRERVP
ncbi:MAG: helicase, partial [Sandaracinaceae bacterium]|nr:helicase [Sandaracinaceae bacterium]